MAKALAEKLCYDIHALGIKRGLFLSDYAWSRKNLSAINLTRAPPSTRMHRNILTLSCFASIGLPPLNGTMGIIRKSLSQKTNTDHPFDSNCRCNVYLSLGLDSFGLYLLGNNEYAQHKMHPTEGEQFQWFPFVIKINIMFGTNKNKHPFLTVTGEAFHGKGFPILRYFIPNEHQGWI
jgi:hypothetical protein